MQKSEQNLLNQPAQSDIQSPSPGFISSPAQTSNSADHNQNQSKPKLFKKSDVVQEQTGLCRIKERSACFEGDQSIIDDKGIEELKSIIGD